MKKTQAIILAAGQGKRIKSEFPKVLHEIRGKRLVDYVVTAVKKAGIKQFVMVVGYKAQLFEDYKKDGIILVNQKHLLGSGHAVLQAEKVCRKSEQVVVLCGDVPLITAITLKHLIRRHQILKASATILTGIVENPFGYGRIIKETDTKVLKIVEEKDASSEEKKIKEINSGIYCFDRVDLFKALKKVKRKNNQKEYYLTDAIEILSKQNKKVATVTVKDLTEIQGVNTRREIALLDQIVNQKNLDKLMLSGVTIIDPKSTFVGTDTKIGKDSLIMPFTVIENNVKIGANCKIGPFAHIKQGTVLEEFVEIGNFVEIKKSKIKAKTKAKHLTYIGDSIVGRKVNIGAGTITANYDGRNKNQTVIGDGAFIGSSTKLVAPVKIGKGAITGAGSVVLKDVSPGSVVVGVPARRIK